MMVHASYHVPNTRWSVSTHNSLRGIGTGDPRSPHDIPFLLLTFHSVVASCTRLETMSAAAQGLTALARVPRPCISGRFHLCRSTSTTPPTTPMTSSEYFVPLYLFVSGHRPPPSKTPSHPNPSPFIYVPNVLPPSIALGFWPPE